MKLAIVRDQAAIAAGRQYAKAIESHFDLAHRLLAQGKPDEAEKVAKGAALLRRLAGDEVRL